MPLARRAWLGRIAAAAIAVSFVSVVRAQSSTPTTITAADSATAASDSSEVTAVSDCHAHGTQQFCVAGTAEYLILTTPTGTEELPAEYTNCHPHGADEIFCRDPDGEEVEIRPEGAAAESEHEGEEDSTTAAAGAESGENCHFHAGVEHCGDDEPGVSSEATSCERVNRDYNTSLRIGILFVVLVSSALSVFLPIFIASFTRIAMANSFFLFLRQFGTGVIISTATIHLFTHAIIVFGNSCLGELSYEPTTAAIVVAGVIISFVVDYLSLRFLSWREAKSGVTQATGSSTNGKAFNKGDHGNASLEDNASLERQPQGPSLAANEKIKVYVLEAGIIFHSLLIGLTLVVAGDSVFRTLLIVVIFHQMFEGLALGTQIGKLPSTSTPDPSTGFGKVHPADVTPLWSKILMGLAFALITPIGMAIGIGVLDSFNGNDPSTIVAIGTLNALSAGILLWVGLFDMLGSDWFHGELARASPGRTALAGVGLVAGLALMSLLGKWI